MCSHTVVRTQVDAVSSAYSSQVCASLCSRVPGAACFRIRHIFSPLSQEEGTVLEAFAHFSWLESARRGWPQCMVSDIQVR